MRPVSHCRDGSEAIWGVHVRILVVLGEEDGIEYRRDIDLHRMASEVVIDEIIPSPTCARNSLPDSRSTRTSRSSDPRRNMRSIL